MPTYSTIRKAAAPITGGTDLAVDRRRRFDSARNVRLVADALRQRDGEGAGGHYIGDRAAGDSTGRADEITAALAGPPRI